MLVRDALPWLHVCAFACGLNLVACAPTSANREVTTEVADPEVAEPDPHYIRQIEAELATADFYVETTETVDALNFGLVGDGVTDNTEAFRNLLSTSHRTIHIPPGDYVTGKFRIPSNTILNLEPGVIIRDSGHLAKHDRLINIFGENVRIKGLGAMVVSRRSDYTTDEWRHGVYIFGAKRVLIEGLESSNHGGDGFYIGGPAGNPSTDITLRGCLAHGNRRQGLSVTSGRMIRVIDCEFTNTYGTAPQFGVDLEPNEPVDFLDDIVFIRPQTRSNEGGGIMICLKNLTLSSHPVSVTILEHASAGEEPPFETLGTPNVTAILRYSRS